ncbi:MAG: hypothetical protein J6T57_02580 [Alphaproteobacteria bacterium]|nr:hypothetical protein [Alphaproteobacteria bacterium]
MNRNLVNLKNKMKLFLLLMLGVGLSGCCGEGKQRNCRGCGTTNNYYYYGDHNDFKGDGNVVSHDETYVFSSGAGSVSVRKSTNISNGAGDQNTNVTPKPRSKTKPQNPTKPGKDTLVIVVKPDCPKPKDPCDCECGYEVIGHFEGKVSVSDGHKTETSSSYWTFRGSTENSR